MARTLSSAVAGLVAGSVHHVCHLLSFTVGATTYRFTDGDAITFQGNLYTPHLILEEPVRYTQKPQLTPVRVKLQNIDLQTAAMLQAEQPDVQGQEGLLARLFLRANESVILFIGRISEIEVSESAAVLTLAGDLDPTASQVPKRKYSNQCVWDFKDANCGYVNGVDPDDPGTALPFVSCSKDFLACGARGRQHRFPGFIHISRELTETIEGQLPDAKPEDRTLSEVFLP